jgi:MFS family permease
VLATRRARALIATSGAVALAAGMLNVAELVLAQRDLAAGGTGYALMICVYSVGFLIGSALAARRDGFVSGIALLVVGMLGTAVAPDLGLVLVTFTLTGAGNGLFIIGNRVTLQREVPERLHGRTFGLVASLDSWALAASVLGGGALVSTLGARPAFALSGVGLLVAGLVGQRVLRPAAPSLVLKGEAAMAWKI